MTESPVIPDRVHKVVADLPSGQSLIDVLQRCIREHKVDVKDVEVITKVIEEARSSSTSVDVKNATAIGAAPVRTPLTNALSVIENCSFVVPRGKHTLAFFPTYLMIQTSKNEVNLPYDAIKKVIIIDKIPKDTKGRVLIYLHLDSTFEVLNGKVQLAAIVIQLNEQQCMEIPNPAAPDEKFSGPAAVVVCQALGSVGVSGEMFCSPNPSYFISSEGSHAGVEAYIKARQGHLYPLPTGLCFLESPATFIPLEAIRAIELARASGASSTFDLYVHFCLKKGEKSTIEFSNICRNEITSIERWIRHLNISIGPTASSAEESDSEGGNLATSDDASDEDFAPSESESDAERASSKKRRKLKNEIIEGRSPASSGENNKSPESSSSISDSSEDDSSVELVSEEDFSMGALQNLMADETEEKSSPGE